MRVIVEPYNPFWPVLFSSIKSSLQVCFRSVPILAIEHVGSTSVPNLPAKPIIDIDVVVSHPDLASAVAALETVGYKYVGERGIPERHALREPGLEQGLPHTRNLYVCIEGCLALQNHIVVRETLKRDQTLRDEYAAVKMKLAERDFEDVDEYAEAKSEVLGKILGAGGLEKEKMEDIKRINERNSIVMASKR